jgi:hypothetical protein
MVFALRRARFMRIGTNENPWAQEIFSSLLEYHGFLYRGTAVPNGWRPR